MRAIFLCPICDQPLDEGPRSFVCPHGHAFDRARSGYVNLHPSARLGDTREMLQARRAFLERGFFQPIAVAVNDQVVEHLHALRTANQLRGDEVIVDAGCGEGYYLERLAGRPRETGTFAHVRLVGIDASKDGVRMTASRLRGQPCAVMDIAHGLHLRRGSAAVLLNVFAPRNPGAFAETLMPGGLCLVVIPRAEHMQELRALLPLLEIPATKHAGLVQQFAPHLTLVRSQDLDGVVELDAEAVREWVRMGPNAWHLTPEQVSAVRFPGTVVARIACTLLSFEKGRVADRVRE